MKFYQKVYELRTGQNLSQERLAEQLSVSRQTVAKWETGKAWPEVDKLIQLGQFFGVSLDELLNESGYGETPLARNQADAPRSRLIAFLLLAKRHTYAANTLREESCRHMSRDAYYESGSFAYLDSYFGGEKFTGQEIVYENNIPVWSMNYIGRVTGTGFSPEFHKQALLAGTERYPYRGPLIYTKGQYAYHNHVRGQFDWFEGREEIFFGGERIYECLYHGGEVLSPA